MIFENICIPVHSEQENGAIVSTVITRIAIYTRGNPYTHISGTKHDDDPKFETYLYAWHDEYETNQTLKQMIPVGMTLGEVADFTVECLHDLQESASLVYDDAVISAIEKWLHENNLSGIFNGLPALSWSESGMSEKDAFHLIFGTW